MFNVQLFALFVVNEEVQSLWLCQYFSILFTEDENLVFRGNSFATKAMDSYMKMIGESVSWVFLFILVITFLSLNAAEYKLKYFL